MPAPKDPIKKAEWIAKLSAAHIGKPAWNRGLTKETDPRVAKHSAVQTGKKQPNISAARKGCKTWIEGLTKETDPRVAKISAACTGNPNVVAAHKKLWQDPEYVSKQMVARHVFPNKAEKLLGKILNILYPGEFKYVGDGKDKTAIIGGRCPDFININGKKRIIEHNGDYHHGEVKIGCTNAEEEQRQISHYAKYGYQTLIIWEHELKNENVLCQKIRDFVEK